MLWLVVSSNTRFWSWFEAASESYSSFSIDWFVKFVAIRHFSCWNERLQHMSVRFFSICSREIGTQENLRELLGARRRKTNTQPPQFRRNLARCFLKFTEVCEWRGSGITSWQVASELGHSITKAEESREGATNHSKSVENSSSGNSMPSME